MRVSTIVGVIAGLCLITLASATSAQQPALHVDRGLMRDVTEALAAPEMEGRGTAQPGGARAAHYLERQFAAAGLKQLPGTASYLQKVDARGFRFSPDSSLSIGNKRLVLGRDFAPLTDWMTRGRWPNRVTAAGELVFVGLGIESTALGRHDLDGLNLRGKIAVIVAGVTDKGTMGQWSAVDYMGVQRDLARRGAIGILQIGRAELTGDNLYSLTRRSVTLYDLPPGQTRQIPTLMIRETIARGLFAAGAHDFDRSMAALAAGQRVSQPLRVRARIALGIKYEPHPAPAYNVIGFIPGSDPTLRDQAVIITAHYDAFGKELAGTVYTGAGDNALGAAKLVAVGQALARQPTRRSVILVATTGEEMWFLGALRFVNSNVWPLRRMAADLNMDGIGSEAWGPVKLLHVMADDQTTIRSDIQAIATELGVTFFPDPLKSSRLFQRSDQFEFARRGVPSAYVVPYPDTFDKLGPRFAKTFNGVIHETGDVIGKDWNWDGVRQPRRFTIA